MSDRPNFASMLANRLTSAKTAPQIIKVRTRADWGYLQYLLPNLGDLAFQSGRWWTVRERLCLFQRWRRKRLPIKLSIGRQWHRVEPDELRWHHAVRQLPNSKAARTSVVAGSASGEFTRYATRWGTPALSS